MSRGFVYINRNIVHRSSHKMSFRPRERVVSVIRKLFKTSEEKTDRDAGNDRGGKVKSPVRRNRR